MNQPKGVNRQPPISEFYIEATDCSLKALLLEPLTSYANSTTTLVFLHEGLGCIELWRDFPQQLCDITGFRGLVYNRKGYNGKEPCYHKWTRDYLVKEARLYLPEVLSACGIEQAILVGHSDGGSIALIAAATLEPSPVGIITEAAHVFVEDVTIRGIQNAVEAYHSTNLKEKLTRYQNGTKAW